MVFAEEMVVRAPAEHPKILINKWRVREGCPISVGCILLFYHTLNGDDVDKDQDKSNDKIIHKLKAGRAGVVKKKMYKDGDVVQSGEIIMELSKCSHTTVIKDMCADCGEDLRQNESNQSEASVPMIHSEPDLKVTQKLAQKLGRDDTKRLLNDRKLVLLVDLDQTIIHTTNDNVPNNIKGIYHFQLYGPHSLWYHTRLRPRTLEFLENISKYYELHICTFGARNYAHMIAQILDPDGKYFSHRILSRDECFNATSKTDNLKALFPNGDSMVCIIDDREDVWNMALNLIQVKPYHFFQHTGDINAPPGLSKHELDGEGVDFKDMKTIEVIKNDQEDKIALDCDKEKLTESDCSENVSEKSLPINDDVEMETISKTSTKTMEMQEENVDLKSTEPLDVKATSDTTIDVQNDENEKNSEQKLGNEEAKDPICNDESEASAKNDTAQQSTSKALKTAEGQGDQEESSAAASSNVSIDVQEQIEIEDPDDYLFDLENILKNIHTRFYEIFDETNEIPDLKIIVPKIRSEVLRGLSLVFSGLVPTNVKLEQSRVYFIAKSLGADVSQDIGPKTTHLVAVTSGTVKVNTAKKNPNVKLVNANWLWSCAERWEHVDERLFPLDRKTKNKQRHPPAHCHSPEHVVDYSDKSEISQCSIAQQLQLHTNNDLEKFSDTINPLLSFSNDELADMNQEFEQFFESGGTSSSDDEYVNIENPPEERKLRKRKRRERDEERTREFFTRKSSNSVLQALNASTAVQSPAKDSESSSEGDEGPNKKTKESYDDEDDDDDDDDDESPNTKFRRGEGLPSDLDVGSDSANSANDNPDSEDDGTWNMMGAALEREFLGLEGD